MPDDPISVGELSRQLRDVLVRFEGLTRRMDDQYVRRDSLELVQANLMLAMNQIRDRLLVLEKESIDDKDFAALNERLKQQEDNARWLVRLVIGFVILGILGALFAISGGPA